MHQHRPIVLGFVALGAIQTPTDAQQQDASKSAIELDGCEKVWDDVNP